MRKSLLVAVVLVAVAVGLGSDASRGRAVPAPERQYRNPDFSPEWSPDGKWLMYRRETRAVIQRLDGGGRRVTSGVLGWFPGGRLGLRVGHGREIYSSALDGSGRRRLTSGELPVWTPDGRLLAVQRYRPDTDTTRLVIVEPGARREHVIPQPRCRCSVTDDQPVFSPDSRWLVFSRFIDANPAYQRFEFMLVPSRGGPPRRLFSSEVHFVTWAPDSTRVAGTTYDRSNRPRVTVIPRTGRPTFIPESTRPAWSPTTNQLAYATGGSIVVTERNRMRKQRVYSEPAGNCLPKASPCNSPSWSPDGRRLLYQAGEQIIAVDLKSGTPRTVGTGRAATWSPNGRKIGFAGSECGPGQGIWVTDVVTGRRARLSHHCTIHGTSGADKIIGTVGDDTIDPRTGRDTIEAGSGADTILAADGEIDTIDCGEGRDRATLDRQDVIRSGCEAARRRD